MRMATLSAIIFTPLLFISFTAESAMSLPPAHTVTYHIRRAPTSNASDVIFTLQLELIAEDGDGEDIGWRVAEIRFRDFGSPGRSWVDTTPIVNSDDGLWWVMHTDPLAPMAADFAEPPHLQGMAAPVSGTADELDYSFVGKLCDTVCLSLFSGDVGALDFWLSIHGDAAPFLEGHEEPTAISDEPSPPGA